MKELERKILEYFSDDALLHTMYESLRSEYSKADIRTVFNSLVTLGYIIRTNPRAGKAASYKISSRGTELISQEMDLEAQE